MQIVNISSNYNPKDKVNFKGSYKVNPDDIKGLAFESYNYLRKGGEADTFIKSLDKSIKAVVKKEEQKLLCNLSTGHDIQLSVEHDIQLSAELDVEDVDIVKDTLEESGQLIELIIKIAKEKTLKISHIN